MNQPASPLIQNPTYSRRFFAMRQSAAQFIGKCFGTMRSLSVDAWRHRVVATVYDQSKPLSPVALATPQIWPCDDCAGPGLCHNWFSSDRRKPEQSGAAT